MLQTERLILRTWDASDWTALQSIATDIEVMRYITGGVPWSDERIQMFVDSQLNLHSERGFCRWKLVEKSTGDFVGFCGVGWWRDMPDPEIGWWLARRYWGQGLATEAARLALRDALERAGLERIISIAMKENTASRRIMTKIGLSLESVFERDGVQLVRYGIHVDARAANRTSA